MRASAFGLAVIVVTAGTVGCIGSEGTELGFASEQAPESGPIEDRASLHPDRLAPVSGVPAAENRTFEATFGPADSEVPGGLASAYATGDHPNMQSREITELFERGVPTHVNVTVSSDADGGLGDVNSDYEVWIEAATAEFPYDGLDNGAESIDETFTRRTSEPVHLMVRYIASEPDQTEVTYTVNVETRPRAGTVASGMPLTLDLDEGQSFDLVTDEGTELAFTAYGPDGNSDRATSSTGAYRYVAEAPGDHTLVVHGLSARDVTLRAPAETALDPEIAQTRLVQGEPQPTDGEGNAQWSFETSSDVLLAALHVQTGQNSWTEAELLSDPRAVIEAPNGTVLDTRNFVGFNCVPCTPPRSPLHASLPGDPELAPGTYDLSVENVYGMETTVAHRFVAFDP